MVLFSKNKSDRRQLLASMDQIVTSPKIHDNGMATGDGLKKYLEF